MHGVFFFPYKKGYALLCGPNSYGFLNPPRDIFLNILIDIGTNPAGGIIQFYDG